MNLLYDPLFRVLTDKGFEEVDLPTLMEYLGREVVDRLVGIQRYQADAFHVFLTYLGEQCSLGVVTHLLCRRLITGAQV